MFFQGLCGANIFLLLVIWAIPLAPACADQSQNPPDAKKGEEQDPFENLKPEATEPVAPEESPAARDWVRRFTRENFSFKAEVLSQFSYEDPAEHRPLSSRQSAGFELLKKFSTATSTVASIDVQFRLVRRDNWMPSENDMEGMSRGGFYPEYHNIYLDLYNVLNPFMSASAQSSHVGRFNLRVGRFYLPFGINLQTDTHGTILQLSNGRNFGFERDWYAGFYGSLTRDLSYDVYYLLGSGYYPRFQGQQGLVGGRLSLGNRMLNEHGLEGGVSVMSGRRISPEAVMRSPSVAAESEGNSNVRTLRVGLDGRYRRPVSGGSLIFTTEVSGGRDESDALFNDLQQLEYLSGSRKWGLATQYRRNWQDIRPSGEIAVSHTLKRAESALAGELTYYFRNDLSATRLHWLKFNLERELERLEDGRAWLFTVQYYLYW